MQPITVQDISLMLVPLISVFSPHLLLVFSMMIAFSIAKFTKEIMIK